MSAVSGAVHWAGAHPVTVAVGVFAIGAVLLLMHRGGGSSDGGMSAFYGAQAAQAASNNQLAIVQAQGTAATAIAGIQADQNVKVATVQSQTDLGIAGFNADVASQQELTRQQAQKQQFFLGVGQQQIEGAAFPYFLQDISSGGQSGTDAMTAWLALIRGGGAYSPAH